MIPHVRDETRFVPSKARRARSRRRWGVPEDVRVVLFFGTPRRHKGLLATAQAIAALGRDDVWFVIVGDFPDNSLKEELGAIDGVHYRFIGGQPYQSIPYIVAMGDYTVLLQEADSLVAQYQLPAKLVDALAMGLVVFAQVTPAMRWLEEAGAIISVTPITLGSELRKQLSKESDHDEREHNRQVFMEKLSITPYVAALRKLLPKQGGSATSWDERLGPLLIAKFEKMLND